MGIHGAGAALEAKQKWGAKHGEGHGLTGRAYALPTKVSPARSLTLEQIKEYVDQFLLVASKQWMCQFILTPIGCGLAGYTPEQIAPMFKDARGNVRLPEVFEKILNAD